ncbi:MFS transporter [Streptomyces sp. NPDC050560]|uniref:MFS transporter n=1 Tax=Streptomyces sp. NPDC050560 TaxID=3365630 RepID=UPI00378CB7AD
MRFTPLTQGPPSRRRDETLLRAAFTVSTGGDWIFRFALPVLVLQLTGSAISTALTAVVEVVPYVVIGLFSGVVADRTDRRRLMVGCDTASAVIVTGIGIVCLADRPSVTLVLAAAFVLGCVRPFSFPAFQRLLTERVAPQRRAPANAFVQSVEGTFGMLGPLAGVAVVTLLGPTVASIADAVSFALSAVLVRAMAGGRSARPAAPRPRGSYRGALRSLAGGTLAGFHAVTRDRGMLWATGLLTLANFTFPAVSANLVFLMAGPDGHVPASLAMVAAAQGLGGVLGAVLAPALLRRCEPGTLMRIAAGAMVGALVLPALRGGVAVLAASWCLAGASTSLFLVPWRTYRQGAVDAEFLGRVVGIQRAVPFAVVPLSALVGSTLLTGHGAPALFLTAAGVQCLVWLGTCLSPLGSARSETAEEPTRGRTRRVLQTTGGDP